MIKVLFALIILGLVFALVSFLLWLERRRAVKIETKLAIETNPDAAWLFGQGATKDEIEMAMARRSSLK